MLSTYREGETFEVTKSTEKRMTNDEFLRNYYYIFQDALKAKLNHVEENTNKDED